MTKKLLSTAESFALRQSLHVATLEALMASRRWAPGDLIFQGGTSLHLAHGSPRFSEDLDFLVDSSINLNLIGEAIGKHLAGTSWLPKGCSLSVTKAKESKNPHSFVVVVGGPDVLGAVRVKIELWRTAEEAMQGVKTVVSPVRLACGPGAGMQAFVPTAQTQEIYADKIFALVARPYIKPRDVFDLHWLVNQGDLLACSYEEMRVRLATYPNESAAAWLEKAMARREELAGASALVQTDLQRWLPSSWPITEKVITQMIQVSLVALDQGVDIMREIASEDGLLNEPSSTLTPAP